jgi:hypothetical protein
MIRRSSTARRNATILAVSISNTVCTSASRRRSPCRVRETSRLHNRRSRVRPLPEAQASARGFCCRMEAATARSENSADIRRPPARRKRRPRSRPVHSPGHDSPPEWYRITGAVIRVRWSQRCSRVVPSSVFSCDLAYGRHKATSLIQVKWIHSLSRKARPKPCCDCRRATRSANANLALDAPTRERLHAPYATLV